MSKQSEITQVNYGTLDSNPKLALENVEKKGKSCHVLRAIHALSVASFQACH